MLTQARAGNILAEATTPPGNIFPEAMRLVHFARRLTLLGFFCSVLRISLAICSSSIVRGRPGRASSHSPCRRCLTYRRRQRPTVACVTRKRRATMLFASPAAHAKTICARCVSAAGIERERAIDVSCACSASLNTSSAFGRPIAITVSPVPMIARWAAKHMSEINGTVH
jgi:hypothetical protein